MTDVDIAACTSFNDHIINVEIPKNMHRCLMYLQNGNSKYKLVQEADRTISRLRNEPLMKRQREYFMENLIESLRGKRVFNISKCSMFLFRLWQRFNASAEDWLCLELLPWYCEPDDIKISMDDRRTGRLLNVKETPEDCVGSSVVSPLPSVVMSSSTSQTRREFVVPKTIMPSTSFVGNRSTLPSVVIKRSVSHTMKRRTEDEPLCIKSIVVVANKNERSVLERKEIEIRDRLVNRLKHDSSESYNANIPSTSSRDSDNSSLYDDDGFCGALSAKHLRMEKERNKQSTSLKLRDCNRNLYACMDIEGKLPEAAEIAVLLCDEDKLLDVRIFHIRVKNRSLFNQGSKYCHAMDFNVLNKIAKFDIAEATSQIRNWLENLNNVVVLSPDENSKSDVSEFINGWRVKYVNVPLARWEHRVETKAHKNSQIDKPVEYWVKEAMCPYRMLHKKENLYSMEDKRLQSGGHCSLIDAHELFLHLKYDNLWSLIRRLAETAPKPHIHQC
jgi:hypothetical protein